jgi:hypothetical protein
MESAKNRCLRHQTSDRAKSFDRISSRRNALMALSVLPKDPCPNFRKDRSASPPTTAVMNYKEYLLRMLRHAGYDVIDFGDRQRIQPTIIRILSRR